MDAPWLIRTDTGGTFTDCLAVAPDGSEHRLKLLSSGSLRSLVLSTNRTGAIVTVTLSDLPDLADDFFRGFSLRLGGSQETMEILSSSGRTVEFHADTPPPCGMLVDISSKEEAPVLAARLLTRTPIGTPFPPIGFRLATTRATNALLEKKGAPVVLFITEGFADLLKIGDQRRPELFALCPVVSPPSHVKVIEVPARMDAQGKILQALDIGKILPQAYEARSQLPTATAAIALLHSARNPEHELLLRDALLPLGFPAIACSADLAPFIKLLPRAQTAVVEAMLAPVMREFLDGIESALDTQHHSRLLMMNSAGGLVPARDFHAKDSLLSGPAGGALGAASVAKAAGFYKILTLDMGGTSTDVARMDGDFAFRFDHTVGDAKLLFPSVKIETVAAGGGSICQWGDGKLRVGPESAGSNPGPACYGNGGPLTVTDLNLLLGYFSPDHAPIPIFRDPAEKKLQELANIISEATGQEVDALALARDLRHLAIEIMADAIRTVSVREGADPTEYALLAFGGAGPQHACEVAAALGMSQVLVPGDAGLLSAFGLHHASIERIVSQEKIQLLAEATESLVEEFADIENEAIAQVRSAAGVGIKINIIRRSVDVRLLGQESVIALPFSVPERISDQFESAYLALYNYPPPSRPLELVCLHVTAASNASAKMPVEEFPPTPAEHGPIVLQDGFSTCVVPNGWAYRKGGHGTLLLEHSEQSAGAGIDVSVQTEAVTTELFRARFAAIVGEMGAVLQRTALSTNIKERLDFSCALLDEEGKLVLNAPHIPVHLGALGVCVRSLMASFHMKPGDVILTNHPAHGGSHLPDVTLVAPVHDAEGALIGYVANRAHHAEIGGLTPGSMPPNAKNLTEEGVVISPRLLMSGGNVFWNEIENLLTTAPWPSRNPAENLADLQAQLGALQHAANALRLLAVKYGTYALHDSMNLMAAQSAAALVRSLARFDWSSTKRASEAFDDGSEIRVRLSRSESGRLMVDFTGSSPRRSDNFNATPAITTSAVLYVLRLIAGGDIPLNDGLLSATDILIPPDSILSPIFHEDPSLCPPVVAGNVETSQHIVNALIKAFGVAASSQVTMNNVLFGNHRFSHYETIGGGCGAIEGCHGASGKHSHMTNTAITDPEIIEYRYPVRIRRFSLRTDSGGIGKWNGGDGLVREYEFLAPLTISLLTSKRLSGPHGAEGGGDGAQGKNLLLRSSDIHWQSLPGVATFSVSPGDIVRIETPGGGGWG